MPSRRLPASLSVSVTALATALVLAACSGDPEPTPEPTASEGEATTITEVSPLTGQPMPDGRPDHPVFAVKIENTDSGAPQYGLDRADLVVEELVEGGLTRLAALYYSDIPGKIGHVRSLRGTDIGIAKPVGAQIVATGGARGTIRKIERADVSIFSEDSGGRGFSLDRSKSAPYNRLLDLQRVAKNAEAPQEIKPYFDFAEVPGDADEESAETPETAGGVEPRPAERASVRFSRAHSTEWRLDGEQWARTNGHAPKDFAADNLLVVFAPVEDAGYRDPSGASVPETSMRGSGRAVLLTAEGAVEATWSKDGYESTMSLEAEDGTPLTVQPGKTWIELVPKGDGDVTYR